ncbi:MAG: carbohydrate ABC transporter permease [Clostridia bacterium]|nr:carbohydrate ABC transporter permease [Clostridia bacterium]
MTNETQNVTKVTKESKNKIRVEFERTDLWERLKIKYLSLKFLGTVVFVIFRIVLLLGISYIILYPFITKIAGSFMSPEDFADVTVKLISRNPTLDTYKAIITENSYFDALFRTAGVSLVAALVQMFSCCIIAYGLAKYKFKGNSVVFFCVIFTMVVPHQILRSVMTMLFKNFDIGVFNVGIIKLLGGTPANLLNTYWPMVILSMTGLAFKNGLFIFMLRQFFKNIPDELEESAYIDGSGIFRTFFQIILPLSIPMMITVFLFAFSWQWTDNFYVTIFFPTVRDYATFPTIYGIPSIFKSYTEAAGGSLFTSAFKNTVSLMVMAPLIVVYLFCQRYLIQGIERSGITG